MSPADDIEASFRRYYPVVRAKCARMLASREEADDVAQETFIRLWERGPRQKPEAAVAWMYRTSTRLAIDLLRRRRRLGELLQAHGGVVDESPSLERAQSSRAELAALLHEVPERELEVAVLCRVDGLTHPEAARVAGTSERSVRRLLQRFEERVRP